MSDVLTFECAEVRLQRAIRLMDEARAAWEAERREQAISLLRQAMAIEEAAVGPRSVAVACACPLLGAYLLLDHQYGEASDVLLRGCELLGGFPDRVRERVSAQALLAEVYLRTDRPREARTLLDEALPAAERAFGPGSLEVVRLLLAQGSAEEALGDAGTAESRFRRALGLCERGEALHGFGDVLPAVLASLVRISLTRGQPAAAHEFLERLLAALPEDDDDGDPLFETDGRPPG